VTTVVAGEAGEAAAAEETEETETAAVEGGIVIAREGVTEALGPSERARRATKPQPPQGQWPPKELRQETWARSATSRWA